MASNEYEATWWVDTTDDIHGTPINEENLMHIENGIFNQRELIIATLSQISTCNTDIGLANKDISDSNSKSNTANNTSSSANSKSGNANHESQVANTDSNYSNSTSSDANDLINHFSYDSTSGKYSTIYDFPDDAIDYCRVNLCKAVDDDVTCKYSGGILQITDNLIIVEEPEDPGPLLGD